MEGARPVRADRGSSLSARSWQTEAPLRMLMNNLDPEVAERPDDLVVYGGTGRAARDWRSFDAMVRTGLWDEIRRRGWTPVVQAEQIAFRRSVTLGQRFDVETRMIGLDERAVWFEQRVVVDGDVAVRAYICTRLRKKDGRPVENDEVRAIAAAAGHDLAGEPTLPEWLHEWRRSVALPSARTPLPHTWDLDTVRRG